MKNQGTKAKILEFLIFHRNGTCLCDLEKFDEANKQNIINKVFTTSANKENEHRYKLLYGMLFSMKSFVKTLSPSKTRDYLRSFSTSNYKLHYSEFINGLRFIFITSPLNIPDSNFYTGELKNIHKNFYTPLISKNIFFEQEEQIKNELFLEQVYMYICNLNNK